jgi:ribosomal protein S12
MNSFYIIEIFKIIEKGYCYRNKRIALNKCPQKRATCLKVYVTTPRKPNLGLRNFSNFNSVFLLLKID